LLRIKTSPETEDMMQTFSSTNQNVLAISQSLINTLNRLNNSKAFWDILNDSSIPTNINGSMVSIRSSAERINELTASLNKMVTELKEGKGTAGALLEDKNTETNVKDAIANLDKASKESVSAIARIDSLINQVQQDAAHGHGTVHALLRDSMMAVRLSNSMANIEKGTAAFNQDMQALQHNFLTRKYFKNQAKMKKDTTGK
jgi:phospholipid/cholesterol/gamma-HCH transport system substrate-binding protein